VDLATIKGMEDVKFHLSAHVSRLVLS